VPFCPLQDPHNLTWAPILAAAVGNPPTNRLRYGSALLACNYVMFCNLGDKMQGDIAILNNAINFRKLYLFAKRYKKNNVEKFFK
jgi:hypothetical protein